ncbi:DUF5715 family protein [uncultured Bacteroides sp.]|uniref:DUF5715 family protein n=1 Tax=uncultured Bacteroides sp. TaxID=162156 RepID=UPI002AA62070|nr:DUF5715 family protein [uncultured Bacteroides sp.]
MRKLKPRYRNIAYLLLFVLFVGIILLIFPSSESSKNMSLKLNHPHNIHGVISYRRSFGDLNDTQLVSAMVNGITPLNTREELKALGDKVVHLSNNEFYSIDSLTHSVPYLVPRASELLSTIGANFLDSLHSKGLNPNRIMVTSMLRTRYDVDRLRRRNGNASENSTHFYGTTFDVSWKRFTKVEDEDGRPLEDVSAETLKLVLSEVLRDVRKADKCYVKYELKQGCFHITAR